ncbi:phage tail sheath subtilisin-like domain-containing protein [Streptomyces sp. Tu102]|uniref:phage tail sheath family protein n=1 Tax=Streptomyces sp. Tu102 TaxID=2838019 RepID=UPI001BDCE1BB|nr:phage tail sheath subtilisin-like domain-containing protein [Streptomyces sp. Tu102]MBT1090312.1 phage tail sheath subtilisin-like domain-containing protein [Streptomyces sp. Tu102]
MAVRTTYPGVYIDEFAPAPPIEGVGTSTAAFVGLAPRGDINSPVRITRWETFTSLFGDTPGPGNLWYAVRGFFENGGRTCYVVRASNAAYDGRGLGDNNFPALSNRSGNAMLSVRARDPGSHAGQPINVTIAEAHLLPAATTELYRPSGQITGTGTREITLQAEAEAALFRPGDWVTTGASNPRVQIAAVSGKVVRTSSDLTARTAGDTTLRLADAQAGTRTLRVKSSTRVGAGSLVPGTVLTITQGQAPNQVADTQIVEFVQPEGQPDANTWSYRVTLRRGLASTFSLDPAGAKAEVQSEEFDLTVDQGTDTPYKGLSVVPAHPRYFPGAVNDSGGPVVVALLDPPPADPLPKSLPAAVNALALGGGRDENPATLGDNDFVTALNTLRSIDEINLVAVPDRTTAPLQQAVIAHCEQLKDRFAVLDSQTGLPPFGSGNVTGVDGQRQSLDSLRGYAALYYPWIRVTAADGGDPVLVPPSGHVCGAIATVDSDIGVFKAPANVFLNGTFDIQPNARMSNDEQGELNLAGVNVIRVFRSGGRPMLWGARTTAIDNNWQYVSVRRLFLFLEESIQQGIRWAVFEPNNQALWEKLKRTLNAFLFQQWRDGALFGDTAEQAFYVRIDDELNPFSERQLGRLHIEIGLQPAYPAEFIVVRIGIWDGGTDIAEG